MRLKILENFSEIAILPCMNLITVKGGCDLYSPDNVHVVSEAIAGSVSVLWLRITVSCVCFNTERVCVLPAACDYSKSWSHDPASCNMISANFTNRSLQIQYGQVSFLCFVQHGGLWFQL